MASAEKSTRTVDWQRPHILSGIYLFGCLVTAMWPTPPTTWFSTGELQAIITGVSASLGNFVLRSFREAIAEFEPLTKLEAKIANEQIKLLATFVTNCSTAYFAVAILGLFFNGKPQANLMAVIGAIVVLTLNVSARRLLTELKDEDLSPTKDQ